MTTYQYNTHGVRVSALREVDTDGDGDNDTVTETEYLNNPHNPTGYSQVLQETVRDPATGHIQKRIVYTLGHNKIAQTTITYSAGSSVSRKTLVLLDMLGAIATVEAVQQIFHYDAYGNLLNMDADEAATSILYAGQMLDPGSDWYYNLNRWYDPVTGRFNRLDPFFGNLSDPQSLHKYLYVHADPVNGVDPSGMMIGGIGGFAMAMGGRLMGAASSASAIFAAAPEFYTFAIVAPALAGIRADADTLLHGTWLGSAVVVSLWAFDVTPVGRVVQRVFPSRNVGLLVRWTSRLLDEHGADAPATRRAMAASLQFSEDLVESSIVVGGKNVAGADIVGRTVGGQLIGREVSIYQGGLKGIYDKIIVEGEQASRNVDLPHVFLQVTQDFLANPGARDRAVEAAENAEQLFQNQYGRELKVIIIDSSAAQLFPVRP